MAFPSAAVANYFLELAQEDGARVTPMKLQKLVYFAHGWNLALLGKPLISEVVEAWKFGPVIRSLWRDLKAYGNSPVQAPIVDRRGEAITLSEAKGTHQDKLFAMQLVRKIWTEYGKLDAIQLSNMTHEKNSPWDKVWTPMADNPIRGKDIPDDTIREYFLERANKQ